jgi:hypothetical protein
MSTNGNKAPLTVNGEALAANDDEVLVTVTGAVALIREKTGIPIPVSRFRKDSANGLTPKPRLVYGRTFLYAPGEILTYAMTLVKPYRSEGA